MELKYIIESLLFVHGEPLSTDKLARVTKTKKEEIKRALEELKEEYRGRGLVILEKDDQWQLGTNPENARYIEELLKGEFTAELSRAALETVAIVAYKGPLTKAEIEYLRGLNSSFTLRNLLMRGLVERIENPKDARSYLYRVSFDFLKHFGAAKVENLPGYQEFRNTPADTPKEEKRETSP